mmetsp:Transcript_58001/g.172522  ORF Transcript_58001/g.172522 Transcript_58001/m.172522 type:complete len:575 (+) Transcript_58001:120-1844(+)
MAVLCRMARRLAETFRAQPGLELVVQRLVQRGQVAGSGLNEERLPPEEGTVQLRSAGPLSQVLADVPREGRKAQLAVVASSLHGLDELGTGQLLRLCNERALHPRPYVGSAPAQQLALVPQFPERQTLHQGQRATATHRRGLAAPAQDLAREPPPGQVEGRRVARPLTHPPQRGHRHAHGELAKVRAALKVGRRDQCLDGHGRRPPRLARRARAFALHEGVKLRSWQEVCGRGRLGRDRTVAGQVGHLAVGPARLVGAPEVVQDHEAGPDVLVDRHHAVPQLAGEHHPPVDPRHDHVALLRNLGPLRAVHVGSLVQDHCGTPLVGQVQHRAVGGPVKTAIGDRHVVVEVRAEVGGLVLAPPLDADEVLPPLAEELLQQDAPRELRCGLRLGVPRQPEGPALLRVAVEVGAEVVHAPPQRGEEVGAERVVPRSNAPLPPEEGPRRGQTALVELRGRAPRPLPQDPRRGLPPAGAGEQRAPAVPPEHGHLLRRVPADGAVGVEILRPRQCREGRIDVAAALVAHALVDPGLSMVRVHLQCPADVVGKGGVVVADVAEQTEAEQGVEMLRVLRDDTV